MGVVLAWSAAVAPAAVVLHARVVGTASDLARGDGNNLLVWPLSPGRLRLFDGRWHARTVVLPADCPGLVAAVGAGQALVACPMAIGGFPAPPQQFLLINGRSGAITRFATPDPYPASASGSYPRYEQVGRYWLRGAIDFHESSETIWFNWRTRAFVAGSRDQHGQHHFADLSSPPLWRPLCAPFRRPRQRMLDFGPQDLFDNGFQRDGAWIVAAGQTPAQRALNVQVLGRCGHPYRSLVAGGTAELGGGLVSWQQGGLTYVLRLRGGKQYLADPMPHAIVTRTAHDLVFSRYTSGHWTILAAHIPGH